jgi:hypothetical protein
MRPYRDKNISRMGLQNRRSLGFARDDKGKGGAFIEYPLADGENSRSLFDFAQDRSLQFAALRSE